MGAVVPINSRGEYASALLVLFDPASGTQFHRRGVSLRILQASGFLFPSMVLVRLSAAITIS
jgi:hypothetical protein